MTNAMFNIREEWYTISDELAANKEFVEYAVAAERRLSESNDNLAEVKTRVKNLTEVMEREFDRGYVIACCNLANAFGKENIAARLLEELGVTEDGIKSMDLAEYDLYALDAMCAHHDFLF